MNLIHPFGWGGTAAGGAGREHILQTRLRLDKSAASRASFSTGLLRFPLRVGVSNIFFILFFVYQHLGFSFRLWVWRQPCPLAWPGNWRRGDLPPAIQERRLVKENRALKCSWTQSHVGPPVWWRFLGARLGAEQGLGPSHLHPCEQSRLVPVIPLTLLGARISPACRVWHPASCPALAALVELPELSLACLPKMISSSRAFVTPVPKPGSVEFLFLTKHASARLSPGMDVSVHPAEQDTLFSRQSCCSAGKVNWDL